MTDTVKHNLNLIEDDENSQRTVYAEWTPSELPQEYSDEWLNSELNQQGFRGLSIDDPIRIQLAEIIAKNQPEKIKLGKVIDAKVQATVSSDGLTATLKITSAQGGKSIDADQIVNALKEQDIDLNRVNKKRVVGLIRKSRIVNPGETVEVEIAHGIPPIQGKNTRFECLVENISDRRPHERTDGTLDYYDLGEIPCVEEGTELMRKHPPAPPKNGLSVTGKEIPAHIGKALNFGKYKGARISPKDPNLLIAEIKGQPIVNERSVNVDRIYTVKNVDVHTGHIDYDGTVIIQGNVVSGMKIAATGDVQVFGMVENATIEADGNIDIKLGAIGHANSPDEENHMLIRCSGNLTAAYLENATIQVEGDVLVKSIISNCQMNVGNQIIAGNRQQKKSGITGGHIHAGTLIRTETLGSEGCTPTHVEINCAPELKSHYETLKTTLVEKDTTLIRKLGQLVAASKKHTEESKQKTQQLKEETEAMKLEIGDLITEKEAMEQQMDRIKSGKIIAQKEAFPGVTIRIGEQEMNVKSKYSAGSFIIENGHLTHIASTD